MTTTPEIRPRLVTRALLLRFVSIVGAAIGFFLPLSVVPLFAQQAGSDSGAGLSTVVLLLATVLCELVTPRLIARVGYRWALALGLALLGTPILILTVSDNTWVIIAVNVVRGAGFAISVVAGGALTATLIPAERRGEGLALVGIVSGVPGMLALPAGVWAAAHWGYTPVFVATAAATLLALPSIPGLPQRDASTKTSDHGVLAGLRSAVLMRPATIFAASAGAAGVLITFLPLATTDQPVWVAASALLAQPAASTVARWFAGRIGDRHSSAHLLAPGLALTAVGIAAIAATSSPIAVIGGAFVFGAGFGVLQNATQTLMYARVPAGGEGAVSAIWNAAYDLGMAAGALGAGLLVASVGYPATFILTAIATLPAFLLIRRDRRPVQEKLAGRQMEAGRKSLRSTAQ
ncbi:putative MFS family arabinose efflux permease [Kibdelosporangium banguiense]|uniref:MFS family arabinose efflux permease n=1 Tax=Kibdelosporangium banguiense TaxID=1365924 RepID=A0ABS4U1E8_9PSEU|nr:MFS transporter [Kibdelosporangium banguiense]MBP2330471.1 putative MFS family arabinose efflux permease [Kibdelosporangium banguiense]